MPREIFGDRLPSVADSRISDIFHNLVTNEDWVFDNGKWNKLPQEPADTPVIPTPTVEDAGKVIMVGEDGKYELGEGGGGGTGGEVYINGEYAIGEPYTILNRPPKIGDLIQATSDFGISTTSIIATTQYPEPIADADLVISLPEGGTTTSEDAIWSYEMYDADRNEIYVGIYNNSYVVGKYGEGD